MDNEDNPIECIRWAQNATRPKLFQSASTFKLLVNADQCIWTFNDFSVFRLSLKLSYVDSRRHTEKEYELMCVPSHMSHKLSID